MPKWTKEEIELAYQFLEEEQHSSQVAAKLRSCGFNRSYDAVRKLFKRHKNNPITIVDKTFSGPRILLLDIETLPLVTYTWGIWKQNISDSQIIRDWCILSWSAKWLGDSEIHSDVLNSTEAINRDDKRICESIWKLINEASIICMQNGDRFDIKKLNSRFIINRIDPPSPYRTIDTLKQSRKIFGFTSNKLDFLGKILLNKQKIKTDFNLWQRCDRGDIEALIEMVTYNKNDVFLLEELYFEMLPWMKSLPNLALYSSLETSTCGHCGSISLSFNGYYYTPASRYKSYRCNECGAFVRDRVSDLTIDQKNNLKINITK